MRILWIVFLLIALAICNIAIGVQTIVYRADRIKIENGSHQCISNCSKKNLSCQIEECTIPRTSSSIAQGLDIRNVSLEWYKDPVEDRNKLAINVKWQPRANAGIERTKGYLIDIASGDTAYRRCYNFSTLLNMKNSKDVFYNDCFGKVEGTSVKLGSTIMVNITSLPLDEDDQEYGKSTLAVNIPDCSSGELDMLEECQTTAEGKSTNGQCATNCNTFSNIDGKVYPINCTISKNTFGAIPENCGEVNRTVKGTPSAPIRVKQNEEWYKFNDEKTGVVKVGLNFSWKPQDDASIPSLRGYHFSVTRLGTNDTTGFNTCYSIHTAMTAYHTEAEFFYDCYGRETTTSVNPGESFLVFIESLKRGTEHETFVVTVPNCADPRMEDVTYCIKENNKRLEGRIDRIICENRTLVYTYLVSPEYGNRASVRFCEKGQYDCAVELGMYENLDPSGTLYNISLNPAANFTLNYTISVKGNLQNAMKYSYTDLSTCVTVSPITVVAMVMIAIVLFLFLLIIVFSVWFIFYRHKYACGPLRRFRDVYWSPIETYPDDYSPLVKLPQTARVYVAFSEDHSRHKDVIHWFCTFLQRELAVDVRCVIWDDNKAAPNRAKYVMENLHEADKVVIICSEGSRNCLSEQNNSEGNTDMFTPVVNQACQNLMAGTNPDKYVVAHFDYSTQQDIPELLHQQHKFYSKSFKLMEQLEQLYFRLVSVEQYQKGGILKIQEISRYFDPNARSECGKKLHGAIQLMTTLVQGDPTWYNSDNGVGGAGPSVPPPPSSSLSQPNQNGFNNPVQSLVGLNYGDGEASINHMHALPPTDTQNDDGRGARPKVRNVSQNPHYENLRRENHQNDLVPAQQHQNDMLQDPHQQSQNLLLLQSNQYPQDGTAEWKSSQRQPLEHSEQEREALEHSVPYSTDSSFEIPDTNISSLSPSATPSKPPAAQPKEPAPQHINPALYNPSYHADLFTTSDFPMSDFDNEPESHLMTHMPSNMTQMTSLGLENTMPSPEVQEQNKLINQLLAPVRVPSTEDSPGSGLFALANLDEDEADIEDQIKSINVSYNFGTDF